MFKLDKTNGQFNWVGDPSGGGTTSDDQELIKNRDKIEIWAGVADPDASYSYDEMAVIKYNRRWYLLQTSGCSCPSPSETWSIVLGPTTLKKIKEAIIKGHYNGYTNPWEQEILKELDMINAK